MEDHSASISITTFLKTIVEALKDAGEEIRIYFEHREAPLHFEVGEENHAAVLMPMRMTS